MPYPQPCEYFLTHSPNLTPLKRKSNFTKAPMLVALERAQLAQANTALTNLETCRAGFIKLGVSDNVLPLTPNNVSKLISNALSANYVPYASPKYTNEFPTWLKPGNRRLLQSPFASSIANIVVAQDGTGNYKTISEAVTVASKQTCTTGYNCNIYARSPPDKVNTITTQGRTHPNQNTGISFQNCKVTASPDLITIQSSVKTYFGRPRRKYSRTVFVITYLDCLIDPAGWLEWKGYHVITSLTEAPMFTRGQLIPDGTWLLAAGAPHDAPNMPYNGPNAPYNAPYTSGGYKLFIGFIGDYNGDSSVQFIFPLFCCEEVGLLGILASDFTLKVGWYGNRF
ncbi:hypothetical protein NL676_009576 [Syzygium grande]|nr:hypothetical protein NL676_009576 [Syzygium grande]